jgi:hypothetical protein
MVCSYITQIIILKWNATENVFELFPNTIDIWGI